MSNNPSNGDQSTLLVLQDSLGSLNAFRVCSSDNNVYLATYQHPDTGCWQEGYMLPQVTFQDSSDLAIGGSPFQVLRIGDGGSPYLASSQRSDGTWTQGSKSPLSNQLFSQIVTGNGPNGCLQLLGTTQGDNYVQTIAQQAPEGVWNSPNNTLQNQTKNYSNLVTAIGNGGRLQVIGLTTTGEVDVAAWQDLDGTWYLTEMNLSQAETYSDCAAGVGDGGNLQVLGVSTSDNCIYLIAWQDYQSGNWTYLNESQACPSSAVAYSDVVAVNGDGGNLQVLAMGGDSQIYLATWQDSQSGNWSETNMKLSAAFASYVALAAGNGISVLDVLGVGAAGLIYLVTRQDAEGNWYPCHVDCVLPQAICPPAA